MVALFLYGKRDGATKAPKPTNAKIGGRCIYCGQLPVTRMVTADEPAVGCGARSR